MLHKWVTMFHLHSSSGLCSSLLDLFHRFELFGIEDFHIQIEAINSRKAQLPGGKETVEHGAEPCGNLMTVPIGVALYFIFLLQLLTLRQK